MIEDDFVFVSCAKPLILFKWVFEACDITEKCSLIHINASYRAHYGLKPMIQDQAVKKIKHLEIYIHNLYTIYILMDFFICHWNVNENQVVTCYVQ